MHRLLFKTIVCLLFLGPVALGQIPQTMSHQGVLTDTSGAAVPDGSYDFTFKLYDVATGGTEIWAETQNGVVVVKGIFNVILGSANPFNLSFNQPYWLGITVGSSTELSPRIELTAAAYSLNPAGGSSNGWSLTGNSGTDTLVNFLGTTDNMPLESRVNNQRVMRLEPNTTCPNVIGGYQDNSIPSGVYGGTIAGGGENNQPNKVVGNHGTIGGGIDNIADNLSTVCGGASNQASGMGSVVPGGGANTAQGIASFAAGWTAQAIHDGCFVWSSQPGGFSSTAPYQFLIKAPGGVGIGTNAPQGQLDVNGHQRYAGYFVTDSVDATGVYGKCTPAPGHGYGGDFEGGFIGVNAGAIDPGSGSRIGVYAIGQHGDISNTGVAGTANGGPTAIGVWGNASGGSSNYGVYASGNLAYTGNLIHVTDAKLAENIHPLAGSLNKIMRLKAHSFNFTSDERFAHMNLPTGEHYGLIAQEVEQVLPELVSDNSHPYVAESKGEKSHGSPIKYKSLNYIEVIPILVEAIKEQQKEIEELQRKLNTK